DRSDSRLAGLEALARMASLLVFWLYFLVLEHMWGCSLGKLVLGLRVCTGRSIDPPSWKATAVRTGVFLALLPIGSVVGPLLLWLQPADLADPDAWKHGAGWVADLVRGLGAVLLASTMRARNGYQGLHERVSGTRVIRPAKPRQPDHEPSSGGWLMSFL